MYGAILGDIVGSPYEFDCNNYKAKDFPLFSQRSEFTDDTVMTLAVAKALLDITAFLESTDFEDALHTAVSLGGDSDTLAAITGSIAEVFYGVPEDLKQECRKRLTPELVEILQKYENVLLQR